MSDPPSTSTEVHRVIAVVAHDLLDSFTGVVAAAHTLRRADLAPPRADWLLDVVLERSQEIVDTLHDLARGVPPEAISPSPSRG